MVKLIFLLISIFYNCASLVSIWNPDIQLSNGVCDRVTLKAKCPRLSTKRRIEFELYSLHGPPSSVLRNLQCGINQTYTLTVTFSIRCKNLYRVNISLSPTLPCNEYCTDIHTSRIWLLGGNACADITYNCTFNAYLVRENACSNSSVECSMSIPVQSITNRSPISSWSSNIRLVNAFCKNVTVEAYCPQSKEEQYIEFTLSQTNQRNLESISKRCQINATRPIRVTFQISCKNFYYVEASLRSMSFKDFESSLRIQRSDTWILGDLLCSDNIRTRCKNSDKFKVPENYCPFSTINCTESSHKVSTIHTVWWSPNIKIVKAFCNNVTVAVDCHPLDKPHEIEIQFIKNMRVEKISSRICKLNSSKTLKITFRLNCMDIYHFNVSVKPTMYPTFECGFFCRNAQSSRTYLLGSKMCTNAPVNICNYDIYKTERNLCPESSTKCFEYSTTSSMRKIWKSTVKIVQALCNSVTVEAQCTNIKDTINFFLFEKENPLPISGKSVPCKISRSGLVAVNFQIRCKTLYRFMTNLIRNISQTEEYQTKTESVSSQFWVFGTENCPEKKFDHCQSAKFRFNRTRCAGKYSECSKSITGTSLGVLIFLAILLISIISMSVIIIAKHFP